MNTIRSFSQEVLRFAKWTALIGVVALAACNRAPTPPEKLRDRWFLSGRTGGGLAAVEVRSERGYLRHLAAGGGGGGGELADSWATNAHKWLNVPYDCGVVIVCERDA